MKIAMGQIQSGNDLEKNLKRLEELTRQASQEGAELAVFPEMAYFTGSKEQWLPIVPRFSEMKNRFQEWAKKYKIALCPGSIRKPVAGDPNRYHNSLLFFTPEGKSYEYDKIFLYEAVMPDRTYEESKYCAPGKNVEVIEYKGINIGFSVCFDLRFPELFRSLKKKNAQIVLLPSAFTVPTGEAHWETLVKARAIENQIFLIAPDLTGTSGDGARTYGHSLAIDPWGQILCSFKNEEGLKFFDIDISEIERAASRVSSWKCRREDLLPIM